MLLACLRTKELERGRLGGDEHQLDAIDALGGEIGRGQQGQLVERQRPTAPARHHECHAFHPATFEVVQKLGHPVGPAGTPERESLGKRSSPAPPQAITRAS